VTVLGIAGKPIDKAPDDDTRWYCISDVCKGATRWTGREGRCWACNAEGTRRWQPMGVYA
jgi:hypothetical protein